MTMVYRFQTYDSQNGSLRTADRWATKEAIKDVSGKIIGEGVEVDDKYLGVGDPGIPGDRVDGMTARGFDPHRPPSSGR
jgi:hypothetical protein